MINSINSYSSNLYSWANTSASSKLVDTKTSKSSTSDTVFSNETTTASSFSTDNSSLSLEELFGKMSQTVQKPISELSETTSDTLDYDPATIDLDSDGTLSANEYEELMSQMGISDGLSAEDFFAQYDTDGDGEITLSEMEASKPMMPMKPMGPPPTKEESSTSSLDTDGDGTISADEYNAAVTELGIDDLEATEALFSKYDTDSNGIITADELQTQQTATGENSSSSEEVKRIISQALASYEANYQYTFESENSILSGIA